MGCILGALLSLSCYAQPERDQWVDSVLSKMNTADKISQLMMIRVSGKDESDIRELENKIKNFHIGGIILEKVHPLKFALTANHFQSLSDVPLFVGVNATYGLAIDSTIQYPSPLALGAIKNDSIIGVLGQDIARQMKVIGANVNFSSMAEIFNHQDSLSRSVSFGENPARVSSKALAYMRGVQSQSLLTCATHFPVQSLTITGVENNIPEMKPVVDTIQTIPFQKLFGAGLIGMSPASVDLPIFYSNVNLAKKNRFKSMALSSLFVGDWVKKNMNFNGLVFAEMPDRSNFSKLKNGEAELYALLAGNEILISTKDPGPAIRRVKKYLSKNPSLTKQIDISVRKVLQAKYDAGLWRKQKVPTENLMTRLNTPASVRISKDLYQAAITVARDVEKTLPFKTLEDKKFAYLSTRESDDSQTLYRYLSRYVHFSSFVIGDRADLNQLAGSLKDQQVILISVFPETSPVLIDRLKRLVPLLSPEHQVVICDFGNAKLFEAADYFPTIITAYHKTPEMLEVLSEIIFGALKANGSIPFTASSQVPEGAGLETPFLKRLSYTIPEEAHMDGRVLRKIDDIATEAIRTGATPGCQIIVAKDGKVVYEKNFGYLTYDSISHVTNETIYDLASLTKVTATLQAVMFMHEHGLIDINKKLSYYLPELKQTNKKDVTIIDMLTHQSGLVPFVPLWPQTMKDTVFLPLFYSRSKSTEYPLQVAPNLFASPVMRDSVWSWIIHSKMQERPPRTPYTYRYSDLGFMMMQFLSEKILNQPMEDFLKQNFYEPLGAYTTGYTPLVNFPAQVIAPTEDDKIYRKTRVLGTVHDERAAMMGGIAGHAGLFSSARDLVKLGQMLLQEGYYGGYQYYKPETIRLFTHKQFEKSRRGLGWDKPIQSDQSSPTSLYASPRTFGHTGFTGTCLWVDPEFNLVYIFLSNRVFPDRNNRLINSNIRPRIQDVIYQSIFNYCTYSP
jgi:beta-N-acetylhexosaminidase